MKTVIFSGGGSGGHVVPALTLIKSLKEEGGYRIVYIGGISSIESDIVPKLVDEYHSIYTGKLRRYFSWENFTDIGKLILGTLQSLRIMWSYKADETLVFGTGGFVTVPPLFAAWVTGKTIYIHEQTSRVGLANKICSYFSAKIFVSFLNSLDLFPKSKAEYSGYPVRKELLASESVLPALFNKNIDKKPTLFVTGGGNGSELINKKIKENIKELSSHYFIVHQVGNRFIESYQAMASDSYVPIGFLGEEMVGLLKESDFIISRAGAGTVCELMAIKKRSIFVPLKIAQKNEQFHNAVEAQKNLGSLIVEESEFEILSIEELLDNFESRGKVELNESSIIDGRKFLLEKINDYFNNKNNL